jgi:hypothetical protein
MSCFAVSLTLFREETWSGVGDTGLSEGERGTWWTESAGGFGGGGLTGAGLRPTFGLRGGGGGRAGDLSGSWAVGGGGVETRRVGQRKGCSERASGLARSMAVAAARAPKKHIPQSHHVQVTPSHRLPTAVLVFCSRRPTMPLQALRQQIQDLTDLYDDLQSARTLPHSLLTPAPSAGTLRPEFVRLKELAAGICSPHVQQALHRAQDSLDSDATGINSNFRRDNRKRRCESVPRHAYASIHSYTVLSEDRLRLPRPSPMWQDPRESPVHSRRQTRLQRR